MIVWSVLIGLLAGWLDGFFIPAVHWPPVFSVFCVAAVFLRPSAKPAAIWIFVIVSGLWLDLAWMAPFGFFIIWHAALYALGAGLGHYLQSFSRRGGPILALYLVSFVYFLGLGGIELVLGRASDIGPLAAATGAFVTASLAALGRWALGRAGRLARQWFFIRAG